MEKFVRLTAKACPLLAAQHQHRSDFAGAVSETAALGANSGGCCSMICGATPRATKGRISCSISRSGATPKSSSAGRNFGGGSSREAAVYALYEAGIRCVIAPSFGDIFAQNAVKNGLLTAFFPKPMWPNSAQLSRPIRKCRSPSISKQQTISRGNRSYEFAIDPVSRNQLLNGWDDIDLTRELSRRGSPRSRPQTPRAGRGRGRSGRDRDTDTNDLLNAAGAAIRDGVFAVSHGRALCDAWRQCGGAGPVTLRRTSYVLAIDQGTTSTRAIVFRADTSIAAVAQQEFPQHFPADGEVEHEPEDLWTTTVATCRERAAQGRRQRQRHRRHRHHQPARDHAGVGSRHRPAGSSRHRLAGPPHRRHLRAAESRRPRAAVRGQDRACARSLFFRHQARLAARPRARRRASAPRAANSPSAPSIRYLLWRLTGGKVHATDATNASRTLLFDIHDGRWDDELLAASRRARAVLPEVLDSSAAFGVTEPELFGAAIPICGIAGDQQAALIGQACFRAGHDQIDLRHRLLRAAQHRRDAGRLEEQAADHHRLSARRQAHLCARRLDLRRRRRGAMAARRARHHRAAPPRPARSPQAADPDAGASILVPAFVGLGAPYWGRDVRGALFGLTRATGPRELARAALESVCFQTADLLEAMQADWPRGRQRAKTCCASTAAWPHSDWTMQRLADMLDAPVDRPQIQETTALGAAYLAGLAGGLLPGAGSLLRPLAFGAAVQAADGRGDARTQTRGLELRRAPAVVCADLMAAQRTPHAAVLERILLAALRKLSLCENYLKPEVSAG